MERNARISVALVVLILNSVTADVAVQEGSTHTFGYVKNNLQCESFSLFHRDQPFFRCYIEDNNVLKPFFNCIRDTFSRITQLETTLEEDITTINLTLLNVYRDLHYSDEGSWTLNCETPSKFTITTFYLTMYKKPTNLLCKGMFQVEGLIVTCNGDGIYPQANLYVQINNSTESISTCNNVLDSSKLYFNSICTLSIPTASLRKEKIDINLTVYPNVTSSTSDRNFGKSSLLTLNIQNPGITLNNCKENDIIEGTPLSCTCERLDNSHVPTNISWLINGTYFISSSNRSSVLINIASRYFTNYTCVAINALYWKSSPSMFRPSVLYAPEIQSLLINDSLQNETVVNNKSKLMILCKAVGNPEPSLYLSRNRNKLVGTTKTNRTISWNDTVNCTDSGLYSCFADNTIGTSQKISTIFVKCPQQLQDPSTNERILKAKERHDVSLNISVFGYPQPETYILTINGINNLKFNASISKANVSKKYTISYHKDYHNLIYGNVTIVIYNMSLEDFANYTLIIHNGENSTYKFSITNGEGIPSSQINDEFNWPALGGGLGAAVLVILIAVLSCYIVSKGSKNYTDDTVIFTNEDLYWIDVSKEVFNQE